MEQQTPPSVRVVLSDDHAIVRHAIRTIIEASPRFQVVGEADDAYSTMELLASAQPDVLILDLGLPGKSGLEVLYEIKARKLPTKLIILSMFDDELKVRQALAAGAHAYLVKDSSPADLLAALDAVLRGNRFVARRFQHLLDRFKEDASTNGRSPDPGLALHPLGILSDREREIFYLLADGLPNRVIAKKLFISPRTVETHRARILKKLNFSSTAELVRYAIRNNLLSV